VLCFNIRQLNYVHSNFNAGVVADHDRGQPYKVAQERGRCCEGRSGYCRIETDKATMEVEAVDEGKIIKLLIPGGSQGIKVNTPIAILAEEGESADDAIASAGKKGAPAPQATATLAEAPKAAASSAAAAPKPTVSYSSNDRIVASPLAKRLAEQSGY